MTDIMYNRQQLNSMTVKELKALANGVSAHNKEGYIRIILGEPMLSRSECMDYSERPDINPLTKKKLTANGSLITALDKACKDFGITVKKAQRNGGMKAEDCDELQRNPEVNPLTKRKIAKKGRVAVALAKQCDDLGVDVDAAPKPKTKSKKRSASSDKADKVGKASTKSSTSSKKRSASSSKADKKADKAPAAKKRKVSTSLDVTVQDCADLERNPGKNPKTKRNIKKDGPTHLALKEACKEVVSGKAKTPIKSKSPTRPKSPIGSKSPAKPRAKSPARPKSPTKQLIEVSMPINVRQSSPKLPKGGVKPYYRKQEQPEQPKEQQQQHHVLEAETLWNVDIDQLEELRDEALRTEDRAAMRNYSDIIRLFQEAGNNGRELEASETVAHIAPLVDIEHIEAIYNSYGCPLEHSQDMEQLQRIALKEFPQLGDFVLTMTHKDVLQLLTGVHSVYFFDGLRNLCKRYHMNNLPEEYKTGPVFKALSNCAEYIARDEKQGSARPPKDFDCGKWITNPTVEPQSMADKRAGVRNAGPPRKVVPGSERWRKHVAQCGDPAIDRLPADPSITKSMCGEWAQNPSFYPGTDERVKYMDTNYVNLARTCGTDALNNDEVEMMRAAGGFTKNRAKYVARLGGVAARDLSAEQCQAWEDSDRMIDPVTGRLMARGSNLYNDTERVCAPKPPTYSGAQQQQQPRSFRPDEWRGRNAAGNAAAAAAIDSAFVDVDMDSSALFDGPEERALRAARLRVARDRFGGEDTKPVVDVFGVSRYAEAGPGGANMAWSDTYGRTTGVLERGLLG